eukprot:TRINITY_DN9853_c0_g1_i1.p1 TRINITY_DN9853_c0_g1~~TRINITY_DN9853_c0_g1_i1.p1  ORF type:complete len:273 (+),score=78.82 TRINITY_DN9853_c0_g1_i1:74-820(+)
MAPSERRVDPSDGNAYTKDEFVEFYGGIAEWDRAKPAAAGEAAASVTVEQPQLGPPAAAAAGSAALSSIASEAATELRARRQTVAVAEATTGGLIHAALLACHGAGAFSAGGVTIYSQKAAKGLLPLGVLRELGRPQDNYRSPESYVRSKEVFVGALARHYRTHLGADWAVAESGAADASRLPGSLRAVGNGFTAIAVAGPGGYLRVAVVRSTHNHRERNMWEWAAAALRLLKECVSTAAGGDAGARL